jgi:hypothetical protein
LSCTKDHVLTGGVFGKVLVRNVETKQNFELIDQAQAHKRKINIIKATKDYIFTSGADQKVKQWSLKDFRMVWSLTLEWIPTSLTVLNDTVFIGGPSCVFSYKLDRFDIDVVEKNKIGPKTLPLNQMFQADNSFSPIFIVISAVGVAVLIIIVLLSRLYYHKRNLASKFEAPEIPKDTSSSTDTQTLVTQILRIALPGYKEFDPIAFRIISKLAEGGGGSVYLGEALTTKCAVYGKVIIVKQIAGKW